MNRAFVAGVFVLLIATACGAPTSVSLGQAGALPAAEWCAEYRQVFTSAGFDQGPEPVASSEFASTMAKLKGLADKAPAEIRDDLRAIWITPDEMLRTEPAGPPTTPGGWEALTQQTDRGLRWINEHCDDPPLTGPSGDGDVPPDFPQIEPVGDWQAVQWGAVGQSTWSFFRTPASNGGVCVAFETDPSHINWEARSGAETPGSPFSPFVPPGVLAPPGGSAPPGLSAPPLAPPPVPPPPVPPDLGYKGKLPQCGPAPDLFERSDPVVFWVQDQDPNNHFNILAGLVVGSARSLTVAFEGGGERAVTPVDGTFVVTYDAKLRVARVVPDLGAESQVTCEPLPPSAAPPGVPDFLSLSCQGSTTRSSLPIPPFVLPRR